MEYNPEIPQFPGISFVNGQQLLLIPIDKKTTVLLSQIVPVMQLQNRNSGRPLLIGIGEEPCLFSIPSNINEPHICLLPPENAYDSPQNWMAHLVRSIVFQTLPYGGLLLHGALIEKDGKGLILTAKSGTGKSTACNRLPPPWKALSDDLTLVIPDKNGTFFASPYPTWSLFMDKGQGREWNVETSIPLKGIFLLKQTDHDYVESISHSLASACLFGSVVAAMRFKTHEYPEKDSKEIFNMILDALNALIIAVPFNILNISLTGQFWDVIEPYIPSETGIAPVNLRGEQDILYREFFKNFAITSNPVIHTGKGMEPALQDADLLNLIPYSEKCPMKGDIIYYSSRVKEKNVISRIIKVKKNSILTCGDNETSSELIPSDKIIGLVNGVWRDGKYRSVPFGWKGSLKKYRSCISGPIILPLGISTTISKIFCHFVPKRISLKIIFFTSILGKGIKVYLGTSFAGEFNINNLCWNIFFPYCLFIDTNSLPIIRVRV